MQLLNKLAARLGYYPKSKKLRAWSAANVNRLTNSWSTAAQPINREIRYALPILRARSRELAQNDDYMARFLSMVQTNVVGHQGIILQAKATDPDGTLDSLANNAIENGWSDWGRVGSCDISGRHSWKMIQRLFIRSVAQDGECFVWLNTGSKANKYRFAIHIIDPAMVDEKLTDHALPNGNRISQGIEFDANGRIVAIYVRDSKSSDFIWQSNKYRRIISGEILHCFVPQWIDAERGVPWAAQSMMRMGMLNGYEEAELVGARVGASKMGFFYEEEGEYIGDAETSNGDLLTDAVPGAFERLPQGVKFEAYDPSHPTNAYGEFIKGCLRGVASGLGVSYNSLANDLEGVNYSSLRQGAIDERAIWMMLQDWMIESFNDRVYRAWLGSALRAEALTVVGAPLKPARFEKYANVTWQARRWQWVDPAKEVTAHEKSIALGIKSRSDVIREQGRDPDDVWQEIAKEREIMESLGIPLNDEQEQTTQADV